MEALMMKKRMSDRFWVPGSPLHGRRKPLDWDRLDCWAQRRALVACGYAENYEAACRAMGRHAAAVVRERRLRLERMEEGRRAAARRTGEI